MIKKIILCGLLAISFSFLTAQNKTIDSLRAELSNDLPERKKVFVVMKLVKQFKRVSRDSVNKYVSIAEEMIEGKSYPQVERDLMAMYAINHYRANRIDSAIYYFENALAAAKRDSSLMGLSYAYSNLGAAYASNGDFEKALDALINAMEVQEKIPGRAMDAHVSTMMNIAALNDDMRNTSEAFKYFHKALKVAETHQLQEKISNIYYNLGAIHRAENPDSSIFYLRRCIDLSNEMGFKRNIVDAQDILGTTYLELDILDSGVFYLKNAIASLERSGDDQRQLAGAYERLGFGYYEIGEYQNSLEIFLKGKEIADGQLGPGIKSGILRNLARTQFKLGMANEAYQNLLDSRNIEDSTYRAENTKIISEMQTKYETEQKNQQIALQDSQLEANEALLSKQTIIRNISIAGVVVLAVLVGLIYRNNRLKTKTSEEIANKNRLLEKALTERESLLKEIHHRVKNNLQIIASLLYLQSDETSDQQVKKLLEEGQGRVRSMALIHQKLYENEDLKNIPFQEYLEELVGEIKLSFGELAKDVQLEIEAKDIYYDVDTAVPLGLIINELSTNAFKYAYQEKTDGLFKVTIFKEGDEFKLSVRDNGIGISDEKLNSSTSKSLGLKLTRMLSDQLEGEYEFGNQEGTSFELKFAV
ncbi:MAG: tetratricopeptide repeat protein [bacterium]|nr:tetratricopeptide repeat protein [bacterium]